MHCRRQVPRAELVPALFEEAQNCLGSRAVSSNLLASRKLLMAWGVAPVTAVAFTWCLLLSFFRSSIAAIVVLISETDVVATTAVYLFAWHWMRPKWKALVVTMITPPRW